MTKSIITIQIDKGVPLPAPRQSGGDAFSAGITAAFKEMQIGDSFVYSDETKSQSLSTTVRGVAKKMGMKTAIRKISDKDYRVWRIE